MDIRLRTHQMDGATVVEVGGEVELHSASELRDELLQASEGERPCVVVDLSRVSFIDSTGLGVLVGAFKRVRERGSLSVVCPQRSIKRVFEITGLLQVFPFYQSLSEAVSACSTSTESSTRLAVAKTEVATANVAKNHNDVLPAPRGEKSEEAL